MRGALCYDYPIELLDDKIVKDQHIVAYVTVDPRKDWLRYEKLKYHSIADHMWALNILRNFKVKDYNKWVLPPEDDGQEHIDIMYMFSSTDYEADRILKLLKSLEPSGYKFGILVPSKS